MKANYDLLDLIYNIKKNHKDLSMHKSFTFQDLVKNEWIREKFTDGKLRGKLIHLTHTGVLDIKKEKCVNYYSVNGHVHAYYVEHRGVKSCQTTSKSNLTNQEIPNQERKNPESPHQSM